MTGRTETASSERCPGGVVTVSQSKRPSASSRGWWRADCPSCGKDVAFHWVTGNFRAHSRPVENGRSGGDR